MQEQRALGHGIMAMPGSLDVPGHRAMAAGPTPPGFAFMMKYKDYYETLCLQRTATQSDIKTAYRKLARKYHPDVNKQADSEARFKEIAESYQVLKDPEKRAAYDRMGSNWQSGQDFQPPPNWDAGYEFQ